MLALFMAVGVAGEERTDASGQWKYVLEDGVATITGCVEDPGGALAIPDELEGYPVKGIGVEAFRMCENLTYVIVPDSVTSIGEWAFKECYELTGVTIGNNVEDIGQMAFFGCESLVNMTLPGSVTSIGDYMFAHCTSLANVTML